MYTQKLMGIGYWLLHLAKNLTKKKYKNQLAVAQNRDCMTVTKKTLQEQTTADCMECQGFELLSNSNNVCKTGHPAVQLTRLDLEHLSVSGGKHTCNHPIWAAEWSRMPIQLRCNFSAQRSRRSACWLHGKRC